MAAIRKRKRPERVLFGLGKRERLEVRLEGWTEARLLQALQAMVRCVHIIKSPVLPYAKHVGVHIQPCIHVANIATCHLYMYIHIHENIYKGISTQFLDNTLSYALKHTNAHSYASVGPFI